MILLPAFGVVAHGRHAILPHELGCLSGELEFLACFAESELISEFIENMRWGNQVDAFILLYPVL
jgi:hypothetical protein